MSRYPIADEIVDAIRMRYRSFDAPDLAFAAEALARGAWDPLVAELKLQLHLDETTDLNCDVSRVFSIGSATLQLSLVGPYGVYFRHGPALPSIFVDGPATSQTGEERYVVDCCVRHGVALLGREVLSMPVPLRLFDTDYDRVRVYQALFSDVDFLPGEFDGFD